MTWPALLTLAGGTYLLRLAGLALRGRLRLPARVDRYVDLGATALLVALVATAALLDGGEFAGWARPAGVAVGALGGVAAGAVRRRRAAGRGHGRRTARARRAVIAQRGGAYGGATSYRARRRVNDAVPDVIARRSTA